MGNIGATTTPAGPGGGGSSNDDAGSPPIIFAFWTPFLLLHLGGPDTITAYSVEDNELCNRHLVGLLFELFSAAVIISCSLPDNPMITATFLVIHRRRNQVRRAHLLHPSINSSSTESLGDSILGLPEPGPNYAKLYHVGVGLQGEGRPAAGRDHHP
ncbi:hypothetical protein BAE44_0012477 [Dichanthelium oligosanthes]|uniref:DUF4220 domain-containing protein n=1 Tax=Dichanthelium oligosanthes TaxID=888268 RepID=A0A1E5VMZ6_9POAL|nr:hypothetical protein BAE44_0012477 [Dichanthelium oligosanthes]